MKKIILYLFFALNFAGLAWGQEQENITGKYYITNIDVVVKDYDYNLDSVIGNRYIAKANTKFTAYNITDSGNLIIKFWDFEEGDQTQPEKAGQLGKYTYISSATNGKYFVMDLGIFNEKTAPFFGHKWSFAWGFTTMPIKLRFKTSEQPFRYSSDFVLGVNAGVECSLKARKEQSIGLLIGLALCTVEVDSASTKGYLNKNGSSGAFSPSIGLFYAYENFQIGVFGGKDFITGETGEKWSYQGKPWLGIGMGFTIFQKNKTANANKLEQ